MNVQQIEQWLLSKQSNALCAMGTESAQEIICDVERIESVLTEVTRLRDGLTLITCEPINAEYMAQNILDGLPAYHNTMMKPSNAIGQRGAACGASG